MAKSKNAKKKNHVSKHILKARQDDTATTDDVDGKSSKSMKKKKGKTNSHIKHPDEISSYLTQWKASKSEDSSVRASSQWKFNKNTQSWMIRHMYEADKMPKSSFMLLLEYLEGLEGKTIKDRMRSDASRRCRRHKEYCKHNPDENKKGGETEKGTEDKEGDDGQAEEKSSGAAVVFTGDAELEYEEAMWKKLNDHEKRRQYKRARKILDLMKN